VVIDALVLDLGNVLVRWDPHAAFAGTWSRNEVLAFFADVDFPAFNHEQDAGRTWSAAREVLAASHPQHLPLLDHYVAHFADSVLGEMPGAREVVAEVRALGLRVFGLTNWAAENFHVAREKAPVVGLLDDVLVSGREGVAKPDPRIFALAAERFGLVPARTFFTDDSPANVEAAREAGYVAAVFRDPDGLRAALRAHGVPVPPAAAT